MVELVLTVKEAFAVYVLQVTQGKHAKSLMNAPAVPVLMVEPALMESIATRVPVLLRILEKSVKLKMNATAILVKMAEPV